MDSNTHSAQPAQPPEPQQPPRPVEPPEPQPMELPEFPEPLDPLAVPDDLAGLTAAVDELAAQDRHGLTGPARATRILAWRQLLDRQQGLWLQELAELDALGAAGADQGVPVPSTAGWLCR